MFLILIWLTEQTCGAAPGKKGVGKIKVYYFIETCHSLEHYM